MAQTPRITLPYVVWAFPVHVSPEAAPKAGFLLTDEQIAQLSDPAENHRLRAELDAARKRVAELERDLQLAIEANREHVQRAIMAGAEHADS